MSFIEAIATFFGLICVWLTIKENILCWPAGIIQVSLYIFVFFDAKLYSDVLLHIIYVFLNFYGWYHWTYGRTGKEVLHISGVGRALALWLMVCVGGTAGLGLMMSAFTDASFPYPDAFITVASLIAQWLMAKKKLESWYFWIIVDIVAVVVYGLKELYLTTGLYAVFLVLATLGYFQWRKVYIEIKSILET
jgi:nicotinamide mononucleotide transporter